MSLLMDGVVHVFVRTKEEPLGFVNDSRDFTGRSTNATQDMISDLIRDAIMHHGDSLISAPVIIKQDSDERLLISHHRDGVILGAAMGMVFSSLLDPVGQDAAVTFKDVNDALKFLRDTQCYQNEKDIEQLSFIPIVPDDGLYATIDRCVSVGCQSWSDSTIDPLSHIATQASSAPQSHH